MVNSRGFVVSVRPSRLTATGSSQGKHLQAEGPNESLSPHKLLLVSWSNKIWELCKNNGCWVPANTKRKHAFNRWNSKTLSTKETTQCSEWPEILCSNGNFLVLVDKSIPFRQKGVWDKSRSGSWPVAAFLPNDLCNFPTWKTNHVW